MFDWFGSGGGAGSRRGGASEPVTLHIYDLGHAFAGPNAVGRAVGTGAYHAGVEVYGQEWSFSCCMDGPYRSGIFCVPPRGCEAHVYREAVAMGNTKMTAREVRALIERMYKEWPGIQYDLLRHNCCHFSDALCIALGVGPIPSWVTSLAGVGAMLRSGIRMVGEGVANAPQAVAGGALALPGALWQAVGAAWGGGGEVMQEAGGRRKTAKLPALDYAPPSRGAAVPQSGLPKSSGQYTIGDAVEVWSNTHKAWCRGTVKSIAADGLVVVDMRLPLPEPDNLASKSLPPDHHQLRKAGAGAAQASKATAEAQAGASAGSFAQGDAVEVWSNSQRAWCPGYIAKISDGFWYLAFRLPGAGAEDWSQKQLPVGHKDVRHAAGLAPAAASAAGAAPGTEPSKARQPQEDPEVAARRQAAEKELAAALKSRDGPRIQEACGRAEESGVEAGRIDQAQLQAVVFAALEELKAAVKSKDPNWIEQACRRAEDAGAPQNDILPARAECRKLFALADVEDAAQCGDRELFADALQLAKGAGASAAELEAARRAAEQLWAREAEAAKIEAERQAAMSSGASKATHGVVESVPGTLLPAPGSAPGSTGSLRPPGTKLFMPNVGDWMEVYSNTHKNWFLGRVTKVLPEGPTVVFQLPGAGADDWLEKVVPVHLMTQVLRRPQPI